MLHCGGLLAWNGQNREQPIGGNHLPVLYCKPLTPSLSSFSATTYLWERVPRCSWVLHWPEHTCNCPRVVSWHSERSGCWTCGCWTRQSPPPPRHNSPFAPRGTCTKESNRVRMRLHCCKWTNEWIPSPLLTHEDWDIRGVSRCVIKVKRHLPEDIKWTFRGALQFTLQSQGWSFIYMQIRCFYNLGNGFCRTHTQTHRALEGIWNLNSSLVRVAYMETGSSNDIANNTIELRIDRRRHKLL